MSDLTATTIPAAPAQVGSLAIKPELPPKTAADWVRDMRMSHEVNKTTVGVETDRVTPELLLATSKKLLNIAQRKQSDDPKDSLEFQRFYGPAEYFAEHILRDAGKVGRNLLWKATNRGNVDFISAGALEQHVADVFYDSKLAQMIDGSSPLETVDAAYRTTRIGEGGVSSVQSAPDEMRTVEPSYFGFIDPVRTSESQRVGLDMYMTKHSQKGSDGKLYSKFINARTGKEELVDSITAAKSVVASNEMMNAKTSTIFAMGGETGVRLVPKKDVDYYLPRADEAYSMAANMVTMPSAVKEMRLLMGCLHPETNIMVLDKNNLLSIVPAKQVAVDGNSIPGCDTKGKATCYPLRNTIAKFPQKKKWFKKVVLQSGRVLITSYDHKWPVLRDGKQVLVRADKLEKGDKTLRTLFQGVPTRRTFLRTRLINDAVAELLGCIVRSVSLPDPDKARIVYQPLQKARIIEAIERLQLKDTYFYANNGDRCLAIKDLDFIEWIKKHVGISLEDRHIPSIILSAGTALAGTFLNAYTADATQVGIDSNEDLWVLGIPNKVTRDGLALLFARIGADTLYRDAIRVDGTHLALKIVMPNVTHGDSVVDPVNFILEVEKVPFMVDIDVNDNLYATANGTITHNSKYPLQAVSLVHREAPLVRGLDEASGKDMASIVGKYLGAQYAKDGGNVTAVRKDRIDVIYNDGSKGAIPLYHNFPMNAKGYLTNKPVVKAGQAFKAGDLMAASNYTDDKGVAAIGTNLRSGWISWKGGTFEDAVVISEDAAKKLTSTTMYKNSVDLDKTVKLGKRNYMSWKPGEYTKEQLDALDDNGIIKPGATVRKGSPMILAVQITEPSPGTMGKRILTDISDVWESDNEGVVTDVVKTRKGVRIFTTVTEPAKIGDKVAGNHGNKCIISQILPKEQMPLGEDGKPLDILWSPLGLVSRTNASQIHETLLGKIAAKTGKIEVMPAFYEGDIYEYVSNKLKQNHLKDTEDLTDPETGKKIPGVLTGTTHVYKLKHIADTKMSARGTDEYTAEGVPGGSGMTGCFPAAQTLMTLQGPQSIAKICSKRMPEYVMTFDGTQWCYRRVTDWFTYKEQIENILHINTEYNISTTGNKKWRHSTSIYPTKNHIMYMSDMSTKLAGELKEGDTLAGIGYVPTEDQRRALLGTMMGGSCITVEGRVTCSHSVKQTPYNNFKYDLFKGLGATLSTEYKTSQLYTKCGMPKQRTYCRILSIPRSSFVDEIEALTTENRARHLTPTILEQMGELGFCIWFLDDGHLYNRSKTKGKVHLQAGIATNGFEASEVLEAIEWLKTYFGVDKGISAKKEILSTGRVSYGIAMSMVVTRKIAEMVARNIPYTAIPKTKIWLRRFCKEVQQITPPKQHDVSNTLGIVPIRIKAIKPYVHDKPGITEIPVYDITVDETHKYTLAGGILCSNSKRYGVLEQGAMVGHGAFHNIVDAKLLRGQSNADFWRSIRTGDIPVIPGEPLVHKKFFAHLQGSGVNINKTAQGITAFALSNQGVKDLAGARELKSKDTYEAKNFRRLDGGLFGQDVFGMNGDKWGYIQLDEPLPNPAMEEPLALILNIPLKKFAAVASGKEEVDGMKSAADIKRRLEEINLPLETRRAKEAFKNASMSNKDKMLKRYVALDRMKRNGTHPADFMLDRIPVLPPIYRPISSHSGLTMVSDSNYLYAQMMDSRDDFREAKALPEEYQTQARENLYNSWKELVGLHEPRDVKLKNKHVKGLLKWALGDSPKYSAFHRKVLGASVDTVGRGVVVPNPRLKLNQVGIPINMAFGIMAPFITREMVKRGYTPVDAMKAVKNQTRQATDILKDVIKTHPVQMNRAPTLHKLGIMAFDPVLTTGSAIHVHPSIVAPFNMDFDGDMASIHVPVSDAARKEARDKMYPERNLIAMKDRKIAYKPEKEYMQGLYIATRLNPKGDVRPRTFETLADARQAARDGLLEIDEPVKILDRKLKK